MHTTVNGVRLYFDIEGAGRVPDGDNMRDKPTLVLLHGGPGADHSIYKPAFSALADIAQIVYLDHRGNGLSEDGPHEQWTLEQWGDDVRGLCDTLGIEKPIVLGTSFGGFVAQAYATRHPDHPAALILVSTAAKINFDRIFTAFGRLDGDRAETAARNYWMNPTTESRNIYIETCLPLYTRNPAGTMDAMSRVIRKDEVALHFNGPNNPQGDMDFRSALAKVTCPTLVMAGEEDPMTPPVFSEEIIASLTNAPSTLKRFPDCGHGIVGDKPDAFFAALRAFVEGVASA